jgi:hypothetical protein
MTGPAPARGEPLAPARPAVGGPDRDTHRISRSAPAISLAEERRRRGGVHLGGPQTFGIAGTDHYPGESHMRAGPAFPDRP